jgi:RNA polymerase sigma factor (sigma-70 family)
MARLLPEALQFPWRTDHELVAAVRRGEDQAFEQLYARYRTRICSYAGGMLHDADRAEDVTQEVFISVLRRLRDTERPIAFRPWIYQIARNACIDELRRAQRTHEVAFDLDANLESGVDDPFSVAPGPDVVVERRQQLEFLRGAFRGGSELHHRILVLRELEGLSYTEIGTRLGMSRPIVESTLFRARRRLAEEYEELISGRRCERTREVIDAWEGRALRHLGVRETRQLARHLAHCQPCRRRAALARAEAAIARAEAAVSRADGGVPQTAGPIPEPAGIARHPVSQPPIPLASRRRPHVETAALTEPGSDSLAVA